MSSRHLDRRHSSKESSRRDRDSSRRSSPGPIKVRNDNELPSEFGRQSTEPPSKDDENTVLKRMKTAFTHSPLNALYQCINENRKIKIWTRNFEEIRGICTGYVVAFDKHWNLILSDVDEVYLKPKKSKYPYLEVDDLPELSPKAPKVKKPKTPEEEAAQKAAEEAAAKKPKKIKKKQCRESSQRHLKQLFIRGNNIIMIALLK
ncbi:hypothetical protein AVEN_20585-1 [Araneus ventricosus]|uniref:Sm domain-containing protein n=1 Tax=Araneus ventricosus TaxID=182803 RepID=A0A4Y2EJF2_ARAVE|nr:hypothetical protein AVEN_20585-1 [Araneus ventricosus]